MTELLGRNLELDCEERNWEGSALPSCVSCCIHVCMSVYALIFIDICIYRCIYKYVDVYMYVYINVDIHMYMCIYSCIHMPTNERLSGYDCVSGGLPCSYRHIHKHIYLCICAYQATTACPGGCQTSTASCGERACTMPSQRCTCLSLGTRMSGLPACRCMHT